LITSLQKKSGELTLETEKGKGSLIFLNGNIIDSNAPNATPLGDMLVQKGVMTKDEVVSSLDRQKREPKSGRIGQILVESGSADTPCIQRMVKEQIFSAIEDFSTWRNVYFKFQEKEITASDNIHVSLTDIINRMAVD